MLNKNILCIAIIYIFLDMFSFAEGVEMELVFKRGKKEYLFYQGAPIQAVQQKIDSARQTDMYVKSAVDNISFVIIVNEGDAQTVYKIYNQYNIIKNENDIYESDLFCDLCVMLINSLFSD